jgi:NTE family protein
MTKRALVLSGGGSRGSYQVGAIQALLEAGRQWNTIHGISVGALNASWLAMHSPEEQKFSSQGLLDIWNNINTSDDIYAPWNSIKPINYLYSMWKGSLHSGQPLRLLVDKFLDIKKIQTSGVKLTVGCVNLNNSEYTVIEGNHTHIKEFILASSHLPLVFEPISLHEEKWVDGGIRHQIPILEALKERPDEIDVVLTSPIAIRDRVLPATNLTSAPRVALRASEIMSDQIYLMDCYTVLRAARTLENVKINLFIPTTSPNQNSMNFDKEKIQAGIKLGYEETLNKLMQKGDYDDGGLDF